LMAKFGKVQPDEPFHWYQTITSDFLHGGIFHLAGNMVFLLVLGLRVNELLGDLKFWIVYPLLTRGSSLVDLAMTANKPLGPSLGASGAIMGLAGMYFVFFPVQHVHMAFWFRLRFLRIFWLKLFRMRGFWLLVMWVG